MVSKFELDPDMPLQVTHNLEVWLHFWDPWSNSSFFFFFYLPVMFSEDAEGMANSEVLDQTTPSGGVWSVPVLFAQTSLFQFLGLLRYFMKWFLFCLPGTTNMSRSMTKPTKWPVCSSHKLQQLQLYTALGFLMRMFSTFVFYLHRQLWYTQQRQHVWSGSSTCWSNVNALWCWLVMRVQAKQYSWTTS